MTVPMQRVGEVQDLTDDQLFAQGMIDLENLEFDRPAAPGEQIFKVGRGDGQFSATATGTDMTPVNIYTILGETRVMPLDWAKARLTKRYPPNHPSWPNQPVFYRRPPRQAPVPTIPCPSVWSGGCRKMFLTTLARDQHMQGRHGAEWRQIESQRQRDNQERMTVAAERQALLMEKLLTGGFTPSIVESLTTSDPAVVPVASVPGAPVVEAPFDINTASRPDLIKHASEYGINGKTAFGMKADELRDAMRAAKYAGDGA